MMPELAVTGKASNDENLVFIRSHRVVVKNALRALLPNFAGACPASFGASRKAFLFHKRTLVK